MNLARVFHQFIIKQSWLQKRFALPVIAIFGLVSLILIVNLQPKMKHEPAASLITPVNYIEVNSQHIQPEIVGYGLIKPDIALQAKAEVSGRVTYIHPKLKKGEIFKKGTLLLVIDNKDYLLQLKQSQADLLVNKANLQEMHLTIENNALELELSLEKLKVRNTEYEKLLKLHKTGVVSTSSLNAEKQNLLQQKQEVQQLVNKKTTLPSTLEVMKAQLEISQAKLEKSQRDLTRTKVHMPFDGRISEVYTELNQYVMSGGLSSAGQLFDAFSLNKMIINAQFPLDQFRLFAKNFDVKKLNMSSFSKNNGDIINNRANMENILQSLALTATVEDPSGLFTVWQADVERFSDNLDEKSRTVGMMISVSDSYKNVVPGTRPPLLEGMYMKVVLKGKPKAMFTLPRFTLHNQQIFTIDKQNKLQRINLGDIQYHGDLLLINPLNNFNIKAKDKIITSDIFPAVNGMSLRPIFDKSTTLQMKRWLQGDKKTPSLNKAEKKQHKAGDKT